MLSTLLVLLLMSVAAGHSVKLLSKRDSVELCTDWSVDYLRYRVLAGEPVFVRCALFYGYIRANHTRAQSAGLRLMWYRSAALGLADYEEPIMFDGARVTKEEDNIWFRPAEVDDSGLYSCVLRNSSYCVKVAMSLDVLQNDSAPCYNSQLRFSERAELSKSKTISCPDIELYTTPGVVPLITWYKECELQEWRASVRLQETSLVFESVQEDDSGNYTCELQLDRFLVRRTTHLSITAPLTDKPPRLLFPAENKLITMEMQLGSVVNLTCWAWFGYSDMSPVLYWLKGDRFIEDMDQTRIRESEMRLVQEHLGEKEVAVSLTIDFLEEEDLGNYSCYAENAVGKRYASVIITRRELLLHHSIIISSSSSSTIIIISSTIIIIIISITIIITIIITVIITTIIITIIIIITITTIIISSSNTTFIIIISVSLSLFHLFLSVSSCFSAVQFKRALKARQEEVQIADAFLRNMKGKLKGKLTAEKYCIGHMQPLSVSFFLSSLSSSPYLSLSLSLHLVPSISPLFPFSF